MFRYNIKYQTNAIRSELEKSMAEAMVLNAGLVFAVPSGETTTAISREIGNGYDDSLVDREGL
jgi:hypothetical protein